MSAKRTVGQRRGRVYWHGQAGGSWWIDFTHNGERIRRRVDAETEKDAWKALDAARAERKARGQRPDAERTGFALLRTRLMAYYEAKGTRLRSLARIRQSAAHLEVFFGHDTAQEIPERLTAYVVARRRQGAKPATVRFELWVLAKAFKVAKLERLELPEIEVRNVRAGFFEDEDLHRVVAHLPGELRPLVRFAHITGWRKSECLSLRWSQIDLRAGTVRLEPGTTKSGQGRVFPIGAHPELREILQAQREATSALEMATGQIVAAVFHRGGKPVRDLDDAWRAACREAGVPGRLFHDLRRSAARNLRRLGLPESDIMELCGWETRAMFKRYAIGDETGLAQRLSRAIHGTSAAGPFGPVPGVRTTSRNSE